MMEWQPIETAPKQTIWQPIVVSCWYESEEDGEMRMRWAQVAKEHFGWAAESSGMSGISGGYVCFKLNPPTHWMPLPPTPTK
jgi:hypothetical protein